MDITNCTGMVFRKILLRILNKIAQDIAIAMSFHDFAQASLPYFPEIPFLHAISGLKIDEPNQVWATDITYIPMEKGFVYLTVIMDWYSRKILSWRLSNTLDSSFCIEALEEALYRHGRPEILNSDQGSQ